jgi:flavin-binding protein dodecin
MSVQKPDIEALRVALDRARETIHDLQWSEIWELTYTNGSYDRAKQAMLSAEKALSDALSEEGEE